MRQQFMLAPVLLSLCVNTVYINCCYPFVCDFVLLYTCVFALLENPSSRDQFLQGMKMCDKVQCLKSRLC